MWWRGGHREDPNPREHRRAGADAKGRFTGPVFHPLSSSVLAALGPGRIAALAHGSSAKRPAAKALVIGFGSVTVMPAASQASISWLS